MSRQPIEVVRSDAGQPWHVRVSGGNAEPLSASEALGERASALVNLIAQAKAFGFDDPWIDKLGEDSYMLMSGPSLGEHALPHEYALAQVVIVDERAP